MVGRKPELVEELAGSLPAVFDKAEWQSVPVIFSTQTSTVDFSDNNITFEGTLLLQGVSPLVFLDNSDPRGSFLSATLPVAAADAKLDIDLGFLRSSKFVACSRQKLWWMTPSWGTTSLNVPTETQFFLCQTQTGSGEQAYAIVLPLVYNAYRSALHCGKNGKLALAIESGDFKTSSRTFPNICFIAHGQDPFELLNRSFAAVSARLRTFQPLAAKKLPPSLDVFGWCTWNAFYSEIDGPSIMRGIGSLSAGKTPARTLIIDDGWQDTTYDSRKSAQQELTRLQLSQLSTTQSPLSGLVWTALAKASILPLNYLSKALSWYYSHVVAHAPLSSWHITLWKGYVRLARHIPFLKHLVEGSSDFTKRLRSAHAGPHFQDSCPEHSFKALITELKANHGVQLVYCWHALLGYWSGIRNSNSEPEIQRTPSQFSIASSIVKPAPLQTILGVEPELAWDPLTLNGIGIPQDSDVDMLYEQMHSYLASVGVDGVKVDGQAAITMMGANSGGSASKTRLYVKAMEESVQQHFGANCINCMCHPTECLYSYSKTAVARASDDFWPDDAASWTSHIVNVAYNSVFLGEIAQPDWDMFLSQHPAAAVHAVARAMGGCAVYVSDKPGQHNFTILRRLVLPDGSVLRCKHPGRPTADCLFADVTQDKVSALKIWNHNACNGVLAAFNVQGAAWDRRSRRFQISDPCPKHTKAMLRASDVHGLQRALGGWGGKWAVRAVMWAQDGAMVQETIRVGADDEGVGVELLRLESATATVARLWKAGGSTPVQVACFGIEELYNGGGAVLSERFDAIQSAGRKQDHLDTTSAALVLELQGVGTLLLHSSARPTSVQTLAESGGTELAHEYDAEKLTLRVPYEVPEGEKALRMRVLFDFAAVQN